MPQLDRRTFLGRSALGVSAGLAATRLTRAEVNKASANERLRVGCVGAGGRALSLIDTFARNPFVDVLALADLDANRLPAAVARVREITGKAPETSPDFRTLIDDARLDAIVVGTPDHWHAIPTILACQAGKDVYVEKPDGHNIVEGQRMVEAMRKHRRIVQLGTQSRTTERMDSAIAFIKSGRLGRCLVAKAWESARQGSIGRPPDGEPPAGVDYDMWLGPAPKRPFNPRRFHGHWRWFYDYGTGDLGNDGVHRLDVARWALSNAGEAKGDKPLGLPSTVSATGGKWYFDDLQEWPDTLQVTYRFDGDPPKILTYEMRLWAPYTHEGATEGAVVYGDEGYIVISNTGWKAYGPKHKLLAEGSGGSHEGPHVQNFINSVKSRKRPNADLETVGHPSSVLCHAGNIAVRLGRTLRLDAATESFIDDDEADALRTRPEYRKPWELPDV